MYLHLVLTLQNIPFLTSISVLILQLKNHWNDQTVFENQQCIQDTQTCFQENTLNLGVFFPKSLGSVHFMFLKVAFC